MRHKSGLPVAHAITNNPARVEHKRVIAGSSHVHSSRRLLRIAKACRETAAPQYSNTGAWHHSPQCLNRTPSEPIVPRMVVAVQTPLVQSLLRGSLNGKVFVHLLLNGRSQKLEGRGHSQALLCGKVTHLGQALQVHFLVNTWKQDEQGRDRSRRQCPRPEDPASRAGHISQLRELARTRI